MIQLSNDCSEDATLVPLDFDEPDTPSTYRSNEKSEPTPLHVEYSKYITI